MVDEETGEIQEWKQKAERMQFTVNAEFINSEFDFTKPIPPSKHAEPKSAPGDIRLDEYEQSFVLMEELLNGAQAEGEDGAQTLYVSAAASLLTLAALTLY